MGRRTCERPLVRCSPMPRLPYEPTDQLPDRVRIREVGPRDGFQNEPERIPTEDKVRLIDALARTGRLAAAGADEVGFGDTTGMANPRQVKAFFTRARQELPRPELTAHFHNTRGQGLANAVAALDAGVTSFESSFGELGGCPVPPGSTGNVATEDVVSMLHEMGIETGIDLEALVEAAREARAVLGRPLGSHVLTAGPVDWHA